jgi:hypothetical protein
MAMKLQSILPVAMLGGGRTNPLANGTNGLESLNDRFAQFTVFSV